MAISKEGSSCNRDKNDWDLNCTFYLSEGVGQGCMAEMWSMGQRRLKVHSAGTLLLTGATVELDLIDELWSLSYEIRKRSYRQAILQYGVKKFTFVFNVFIYRPNNNTLISK